MNTREDIHRELFKRLAVSNRLSPFRPGVDSRAVAELQAAANTITTAYCDPEPRSMRSAAMDAAVAALHLVYSLDDALS